MNKPKFKVFDLIGIIIVVVSIGLLIYSMITVSEQFNDETLDFRKLLIIEAVLAIIFFNAGWFTCHLVKKFALSDDEDMDVDQQYENVIEENIPTKPRRALEE